MNTTAEELSGKHLGKTVTVAYQRATVTGQLDRIDHSNEVTLRDLRGEPARTEQWVTLTIGGTEYPPIGPNFPITIKEDE
ncbi:hypothetical protein [Glutamicibacter sp. X7]